MLEAEIPQYFKDNLLGIEIKVTSNDFPGLVIAQNPTYEEGGVGAIDIILDGITAIRSGEEYALK